MIDQGAQETDLDNIQVEYALEILAEENNYINIKNCEQVTAKMKRDHNKEDYQEYMDHYHKIATHTSGEDQQQSQG